MSEEKFHYYLISGEVSYSYVAENSRITHGTKKMNCITRTGVDQFNRVQLAISQHVLHQNFMKEVAKDDPGYRVGDIFIVGFSYMGHMTQEESAPPMPTSFQDVMKVLPQ